MSIVKDASWGVSAIYAGVAAELGSLEIVNIVEAITNRDIHKAAKFIVASATGFGTGYAVWLAGRE